MVCISIFLSVLNLKLSVKNFFFLSAESQFRRIIRLKVNWIDIYWLISHFKILFFAE
jgi:hypothetical protein